MTPQHLAQFVRSHRVQLAGFFRTLVTRLAQFRELSALSVPKAHTSRLKGTQPVAKLVKHFAVQANIYLIYVRQGKRGNLFVWIVRATPSQTEKIAVRIAHSAR